MGMKKDRGDHQAFQMDQVREALIEFKVDRRSNSFIEVERLGRRVDHTPMFRAQRVSKRLSAKPKFETAVANHRVGHGSGHLKDASNRRD
jgi:nitrogen regulatory protein PII